MDIDFISDMYWLIGMLSHHTRKAKKLNESSVDEMISFTLDLLKILELYKNYLNDEYFY